MTLREWFNSFKLERVERELKALRAHLKDARERLAALEKERARAEVPEAEYQERKARMEAHKADLIRRIHEAEQREKALRAEAVAA